MKPALQNNNLTLAEKLFTLEEQRAFIEQQEDEVRGELLANLQEQGVKFVKLTNGTSYSVEYRTDLKVKKGKEEKAFAWATENNALKVDTTKARQILRRIIKLPPFFELKKGAEYLKVTHAKDEE